VIELGSGIDIFLHPGDWYFGDRNTRIRTMLGSCVAVTLWHPELKVGGMCHYLLPANSRPRDRLDGRYGDQAVELLVAEVKKIGAPIREYEVKLFGGATMLSTLGGECSVAERNVRAAKTLVLGHGLRVVAQSLGGTAYRRLIFNLADGDVWVRLGAENRIDTGSTGVA